MIFSDKIQLLSYSRPLTKNLELLVFHKNDTANKILGDLTVDFLLSLCEDRNRQHTTSSTKKKGKFGEKSPPILVPLDISMKKQISFDSSPLLQQQQKKQIQFSDSGKWFLMRHTTASACSIIFFHPRTKNPQQ